jgi:hypothetical protein
MPYLNLALFRQLQNELRLNCEFAAIAYDRLVTTANEYARHKAGTAQIERRMWEENKARVQAAAGNRLLFPRYDWSVTKRRQSEREAMERLMIYDLECFLMFATKISLIFRPRWKRSEDRGVVMRNAFEVKRHSPLADNKFMLEMRNKLHHSDDWVEGWASRSLWTDPVDWLIGPVQVSGGGVPPQVFSVFVPNDLTVYFQHIKCPLPEVAEAIQELIPRCSGRGGAIAGWQLNEKRAVNIVTGAKVAIGQFLWTGDERRPLHERQIVTTMARSDGRCGECGTEMVPDPVDATRLRCNRCHISYPRTQVTGGGRADLLPPGNLIIQPI